MTTLSEFPFRTLQAILEESAALANITIPEDQRATMIADSDGTPKTMVANVNKAGAAGEQLTLNGWLNSWRGTWERAFWSARSRFPLADAIYEAVSLLREANLPARPAYVQALAPAHSQDTDVAETVTALVQRGLLRADRDRDRLEPFAEEQIEVSLQSVDKELPDLAQQWISLVDAVLASDSAPVMDLVALADTLQVQGYHAGAERVATAALAQDPGCSAASFQRGLARVSQTKFNEAVADFAEALTANYKPIRAHLMRGLAHLMVGRFPDSAADFTAAINGGERLAYAGRALARFFQGAFENAISDFTKARDVTPDEAGLSFYYLRAISHQVTQDEEAALADFSRAIAAGSGYNNLHAYFSRGILHSQAGNLASAKADFTHVLAETDNALLYYMRGGVCFLQNDLTSAEADFTEAIARWQDEAYLAVLQELVGHLSRN